jgi:hypothetical protein
VCAQGRERLLCGEAEWTRDIEVVMVSGTGLVVMVSVTGDDSFSVMVSDIETWRFPALGFVFGYCMSRRM